MKILITGVAGFVGGRLAKTISNTFESVTVVGIDNLSRRGSETNLSLLELELKTRSFDVPYYVTDNSLVRKTWDWRSEIKPTEILDSIIDWAYDNRLLIDGGY